MNTDIIDTATRELKIPDGYELLDLPLSDENAAKSLADPRRYTAAEVEETLRRLRK